MAYEWTIKERCSKVWDSKLTLKENAEACNLDARKASLYAKRWGWGYKRVRQKWSREINYEKIGLDRQVVEELCMALRLLKPSPCGTMD